MLASDRTQSLSDFRKNAAATITRLNKTGDAEILTVNGEARAVLMSPAVYDELSRQLERTRDLATMRQSLQEVAQGKGREVNEAFTEIRANLLSKVAGGRSAK